jgi:hypothetical protein
MGVSIGDAQWPYTGFDNFRRILARLEGLDLDAMRGFGGDIPWEETTTQLRPLLDHSDCDGFLTAGECALVAPRLSELLDAWPEEERLPYDYDVVNGRALVRSMRAAAEAGERLEFH